MYPYGEEFSGEAPAVLGLSESLEDSWALLFSVSRRRSVGRAQGVPLHISAP